MKALATFPFAGWKYQQPMDAADNLAEGTPVSLVPEPENQYDELAIRLEINGAHWGYVPKPVNQIVHALCEEGFTVAGFVAQSGAAILGLACDFSRRKTDGETEVGTEGTLPLRT